MGYGVVAWNFLITLQKMGVNTALWPIGNPQILHGTQEEGQLVQQCKHNAVMFNQYAPSLRIWHQFDMSQHVGKGLRCGLPFFELNRFYPNERHHLGYLDRILAPSSWAKEIITREIPYFNADDVHIVPMGVDREIFSDESTSRQTYNDATVFLNMGKWEVRKGHDILVDAFNDAFEQDDDVILIMACENPFLDDTQSKEWIDSYKKSKMGGKVVLTNRLKTHREVAELMATSHCGVFPSRGEGWNMEALEMMSMGKELIITDYSAHSDFCSIDNSRIIPVETVEPAYDGIWFKGNPNDRGQVPEWGHIGDVQYEALVAHMRDVHKARQDGSLGINEAGIETAKRLSWENATEHLLRAMDLTE
jgi:glycosyltransferase involved in cell wall biosynthesis